MHPFVPLVTLIHHLVYNLQGYQTNNNIAYYWRWKPVVHFLHKPATCVWCHFVNPCSQMKSIRFCKSFCLLWRWFHSFWSISFTHTVYPKKYAHGFCFAVLCCGYTLTDFPISIRLTSLALWQSNDCPSAIKATLMNMDKYFMWIHYERLHNHNKAKHNKTVCIFLGIYCIHIGDFSAVTGLLV